MSIGVDSDRPSRIELVRDLIRPDQSCRSVLIEDSESVDVDLEDATAGLRIQLNEIV